MKINEIKIIIFLIIAGAGMPIWAYKTFASKEQIHTLEHKIDLIYKHLLGDK